MRFTGLRHLLGVICFCLSGAALALSDDDFALALDAARDGQFAAIPESASEHILYPYIEFHRLRTALPDVAPRDIQAYAERNRTSPLGGWLRRQALLAYEKSRRWSEVLEISPQPPADVGGQCIWYRAQLIQDQALAFRGGRKLWLSGSSRPDECDDLFKAMAVKGELGAELYYQRLLLALEAGNRTLARYLNRKLGKAGWNDVSEYVARTMRYPDQLRQIPPAVARQVDNGELTAAVISYLIPRNTRRAMDLWHDLGDTQGISDARRQQLEEKLAANTFRLDDDEFDDAAAERLKTLGEGDWIGPALRNAIAAGDWPAVLDWILAVKGDQRDSSYYTYWEARALQAMGNEVAAQAAFESAAGKRDFYGFLAAERLGQPYALHMESPEVDAAVLKHLSTMNAVQRISALWAIGEHGLALEELNYLVSLHPVMTPALAEYAMEQGWYSLAVQTTVRGGHWNYIQHRFPAAFADDFGHWADALNLDSALLMAIARRESSFNPFAQSGVGARGLMQLMPATAKQVAAEIQMAYQGQDDLFQHESNIRLGSHYVRTLLDRFEGNLIAALAGYNAGPHRVERWLKTDVATYDQFIESIPFRETRDYVKAVLAYRVIFNSLSGQKVAAVLAPAERGPERYVTSTDLASADETVAN